MATPTTLPATFVAGNVLTAAQMNDLRGAFRILQVVTANQSATQSLASTTYTDATSLSVSITPSATSSKIYVISQVSFGSPSGSAVAFQLVRGSTAIAIGDQEGSNRFRASWIGYTGYGQSGIISYVDSPATTSATTYKIQFRASDAGQTVYINRATDWADNATRGTAFSSITAMEISA